MSYTEIDRQETDQLGFTYVQGMNVLAAPFLYTMPSELEAFYCFAKFIEESCPLYVQPTLEGVHRGLKVSLNLALFPWSAHVRHVHSSLIGVSKSWILNYTLICARRICRQRFTLSHVRRIYFHYHTRSL